MAFLEPSTKISRNHKLMTTASMRKTTSHRHWDDPGELSVFEGARYFSGTGAAAAIEEKSGWVKARKSLDVPIRRSPLPPHQPQRQQCRFDQKQQFKEAGKTKSSKHPISPGRRLASFLNSLFSLQTSSSSSSKKKAKPSAVSAGDDEVVDGRRKRRTTGAVGTKGDAKPLCSSSFSGKAMKDLLNYRNTPADDHRKVGWGGSSASSFKYSVKHVVPDDAKENRSNNIVKHRRSNVFDHLPIDRDGIWDDVFASKEVIRRGEKQLVAEEEDAAGGSDTSSDLFELQNCDLGNSNVFSHGLPVYETTQVESFKRVGK